MAGIENMTRSELHEYIYTLEGRIRGLENEVQRQTDLQTDIPAVLIQRTDLLAEEALLVSQRNQNWRGRLKDLGNYGLSGGSAGDRRVIVQFMAGLETRRVETGSIR